MAAHELDRDFEWTQVRPGRWERGIDEAEELYTSLAKLNAASGRVFFAITGHISTTVLIPEDADVTTWGKQLDDALRKGWLALRHAQPAIASWTEWNAEKSCFVKVYEELKNVHGNEPASEWLDATCKTITGFRSGQHFSNSDPPVPKLATLFVVKPITDDAASSQRIVRRDLVIRAHHDIMDGIGTMFLFEKLLTYVTEALSNSTNDLLVFGDEWKRLTPPLRIVLGLEPSTSEEIREMYKEIVLYNTKMSENTEILVMPYNKAAVAPGKHQRVEISLSEQDTKQRLVMCKKKGVSVTHAYHAAAIVALSRLQQRGPSKRKARYIKYGLVNLRDKCKEPYCTAEYGATVYHSGTPRSLIVDLTIPSISTDNSDKEQAADEEAEFDQVLQVVKSFYVQIRDDKYLTQLYPLLLQNVIPKRDWAFTEPIPLPPPSNEPSVTLSSLGVIDKIIKHDHGIIKVHNPWVVGEELGNGLGLFLRTYMGQLCLSAAYNDAWHTAQGSLQFIQTCDDIVRQHLRVDA